MNRKQKVAVVVGVVVAIGLVTHARSDEPADKLAPEPGGIWIIDWENCLDETFSREVNRLRKVFEDRDPTRHPGDPGEPPNVGIRSLVSYARVRARQEYDKTAAELDLHEGRTFTWMLNGKKTSGKWTCNASVVELMPTHRDGKELPPQFYVPLLRDGERLIGRRSKLGRALNVYVRKR